MRGDTTIFLLVVADVAHASMAGALTNVNLVDDGEG